MRATCVLAVSLMLICGTLSSVNAANSDVITPSTDSQDSQQMGVEAPAPAERPADAANPEPEPAADAGTRRRASATRRDRDAGPVVVAGRADQRCNTAGIKPSR